MSITKFKFSCLIIFSFISLKVSSQTIFQKNIGGSYIDSISSIERTSDGGYILGGRTTSFGAGYEDAYLVKTDSIGNILWTKTYGSIYSDFCTRAKPTSDGGYIIIGETYGFGSTNGDYYLIKTDTNGNLLWSKIYGTPDHDRAYDVVETPGGNFVMIGSTNDDKAFIVKADNSGNQLWSHSIVGAYTTGAYCINLTSDLGFIISGATYSFTSSMEAFLMKTDSSGIPTWTRSYGGPAIDYGFVSHPTNDGGYILSGWTNSFGSGNDDAFVVKTDANGNITWSNTYGGANTDNAWSIIQTSDNGYILTGWTASFSTGDADAYIVKLNSFGNVTWSKTFGNASRNEFIYYARQLPDKGYAMVGFSETFPPDLDAFLIRTDSLGTMGCFGADVTTAQISQPSNNNPVTTTLYNLGTSGNAASIVNTGGTMVNLCTLGITEHSNSNTISVYPNPSSGKFSIESQGQLEIWNSIGQKVYSRLLSGERNEIDLSDQKQGIYLYKLTGKNGLSSGKLSIIN